MTQEQYKWLQDNGYDPTVHDVDDQGNIFENPINAPAPQKEVMSVPRAFGTSFLGSLAPSAASLGGAKVGMMAGAPFGPWGIGLGALGGGLAAGYGVGKGQQALLENYAPEAVAEMQRAETDQPVASWAGGSAPALLTFKPSFKGISGLSAPIMSLEKDAMSKFAPAAINVAVNAGQSGAGQLLNMAQGGDFSLPRFAADTAFGSIVSNPNALGRKMGFPSLDAPNIPKIPVEQPMDLGAIRATEGMTPEEVTQYKTKSQMEWWKQDEATRISDIENVAKQSKQRLNKGMADELSRLPEVYDVIKNPEKFPEFLANSLEEALNVSHETAQDRKQSKFLDLKEQERQGNLKTEAAEAEGYFGQERSLQEANVFRAATANDDATLRAQAVQAENDLKIANAKTEAARIEAEQNATDTRKMQDLDAAQALSDEAAARLQDLYSRQSQLRAETQNKSPAERRGVKEQGIADIAQAKQELADARAIAADLYTRLQTAGGKGLMSQADLDAATSLAAQRGLRVLPATPEQQAKGIRGAYVVNENGEGIIYINPFAATADTAIHEIGHDVFKRSPNERMRRSLMDTAEGSEAYKAEYAARIAAQDKNGNPAHTEQQAHDFALEEGIVQAFGEAYPNVKPGEIRQWFNALKSSVKSMLKMKLSPEDAIAWMHYATTEAVPWKGMAVAKTGGQERLQRGEKPPELEALNAQLKQAQEAERTYKQQNPYDREGIKALEADSKKAMNAYFEKSQAYEEANPKYPGIENAPEFLPSEDKYYRSFQDPADDQTGLRHMAQGKIWPDAFVMEIESPRGVIDANNNALRGRFKPEQVTKIIHDVDSFEPYPHDYIAELQRKYPNAEIVDGVLNDREDGYRILGPAKSEPTDASSNVRYQRKQQETPEFKNWFGESKVVDADGKPLTVYHGTDADFTSFKQAKEGYFGKGIYLTPNPDTASGYAASSAGGDTRGEGGNVMPLYASIKNPMSVVDDGFTILGPIEVLKKLGYSEDKALAMFEKAMESKGNLTGELQTKLKLQGYDGIITNHPDGTIREIIAFYPTQIKSATGNRGTFDPSNPDIRYQRPIVGKAKEMYQETANRALKFAEIDNLESRGGIHAVVAKGMRAFYATRSFMEGKPQAFEKAIYALSPERQVMLGEHIGQEFDQRRFIKPSNEIAEAYGEYRQQWQKFWPSETNKVGHTVRTAGGQRERLTDPYYGPFHMWSDNVRDIMTNKQGSPEYVKLQDDYIKQHVQAHQQRGIPLQEAQTRAAAEFSEEIRALSVPYDPTAAGTFAGARKAQGIPLPHSWREYNIAKLLKSYDRRSAIDFAMQEHMEKSPEIMAALGSKTFFNDQPIPAQIKAAIPDISTDKSVQSILREMSGQPATKPDSVGAGASRGISALTIGTVSKATEVPTTMIAGLRYLQMSDYLPGTMKFIEKLADWSALQERSYASGLNKRDASQNMRQVSGVAENAAGFLNKFAEGVSSVTGLNQLESAARTIAQGWGEVLVQINKNKAATGDKDAVRMMDTLSPDWRTRSDADLAAQFGKLMQGSYDMTQLPAWMLESGAAPYLTWSKWSAGQYSNFVKFAIEPAMQGNVKPLIGHLLIGAMGGAAVDQIREWMNNREGRDVNWSELESWMQQNQGQLGAEGMKQLSVKLLNIVQGVGTFGIAGDIAKMVTTAAVGGSAQGIATAPVANAVFDTGKKIAAALKAIDDGEDFGLVLRQAMGDVAKTHVQVARVWNNWTDEQENLRYDDRRQRRLFDELTGAPTQAGTFSVNYGNLAERAFERGSVSEKTGEEAFNLVSRARQEATSGEDYASRIRKLKTSQNAIMPSLERQPMKAARYLGFVEGAEPGKGSETLKRYYTRQNEDKYRKSLIEGMSGIR